MRPEFALANSGLAPINTITSGGGEVDGARLRETLIGVEGDLSGALECAPADSAVLLLATRGSVTVGAGSG